MWKIKKAYPKRQVTNPPMWGEQKDKDKNKDNDNDNEKAENSVPAPELGTKQISGNDFNENNNDNVEMQSMEVVLPPTLPIDDNNDPSNPFGVAFSGSNNNTHLNKGITEFNVEKDGVNEKIDEYDI